jgi:hypothetical protein
MSSCRSCGAPVIYIPTVDNPGYSVVLGEFQLGIDSLGAPKRESFSYDAFSYGRAFLDPPQTIFSFASFVISLANCRNVRLAPHSMPERLARSFQRRRGRPPVRFRTLEIEGRDLRYLNREDAGGGMAIRNGRALHIARGHFKTYSAERPLFGSIPGTFWWAPTVRGDAKAGAVLKDYAVLAPEGD